MYVCMYVSVYVCIYIYIYIYIYICVCVCMGVIMYSMCIHISTRTYMPMCVYIYIYIYVCVCTYMYIHVCNVGWRVQALAFRQCLGLCLFEVQSNRFSDLQPVGLGSRMLGLGRRGQEAFAKPHETQTLFKSSAAECFKPT